MAGWVLQGERVQLREWQAADLPALAAMNADPAVMRHFEAPMSAADSEAMAERLCAHHARLGFGWWVLEVPGLRFAGLVGLLDVGFELAAAPPPQVQIGWRLPQAAWGRGWATEAAQLCLDHARHALGLPRVLSFTTLGNLRSMAVMQRLGMVEIDRFEHPRVTPGHPVRPHVLYATRW
jgi:RimJ/RimL family protein N-acetyltransferase